MGLLKAFKDQHDDVEQEKLESDRMLLSAREELLESKKVQESIIRDS